MGGLASVILDYHMHLRDRHGNEPGGRYPTERVELYVEQAVEAGVDEIGFSDHGYHFRQTAELWDVPWLLERSGDDLDEYVDAVESAKARGLPVKLGLELDFVPGCEEGLAVVVDGYPWDYLIGSVHFVDGLSIDMEPSLVGAVGPAEAARRYFEWVEAAARSGLVDVLAHVDLIKFFGDVSEDDYPDGAYEGLVVAATAGGACIEISTAGLRKPHGRLYPEPALLTAARQAGLGITLASDAHVPDAVGRDFPAALERARACGYDAVSVFERRSRRQEPLG